jgi:hypothetical protein
MVGDSAIPYYGRNNTKFIIQNLLFTLKMEAVLVFDASVHFQQDNTVSHQRRQYAITSSVT